MCKRIKDLHLRNIIDRRNCFTKKCLYACIICFREKIFDSRNSLVRIILFYFSCSTRPSFDDYNSTITNAQKLYCDQLPATVYTYIIDYRYDFTYSFRDSSRLVTIIRTRFFYSLQSRKDLYTDAYNTYYIRSYTVISQSIGNTMRAQ